MHDTPEPETEDTKEPTTGPGPAGETESEPAVELDLDPVTEPPLELVIGPDLELVIELVKQRIRAHGHLLSQKTGSAPNSRSYTPYFHTWIGTPKTLT